MSPRYADLTAIRLALFSHEREEVAMETGGIIVRCRCGKVLAEVKPEDKPAPDAIRMAEVEHILDEILGPNLR